MSELLTNDEHIVIMNTSILSKLGNISSHIMKIGFHLLNSIVVRVQNIRSLIHIIAISV